MSSAGTRWCGARCPVRRCFDSVLRREYRLRGRLRPADEMRWSVGLDSLVGLVVSVALLGYLIVALLRPEKF